MCMKNRLQSFFPMIRTREEVLSEIYARPDLTDTFEQWNRERQKEFLDFCSGAKGVKMLYDGFFKEIMDPESTPERLEEFLSLLLLEKVRILSVLPNDSARVADESSLLIMDIVVMLEDGSIANVEIQKIGYQFPGERSACYSSDLLLRQYKRVRGRQKKEFVYNQIKNVYTIVIFDKSTHEFKEFPDTYIHRFEQKSDSGIKMELLQKYIFIPLDIFRKNVQNNSINSKLEGWLAFLSMDTPSVILELIERYPEFRELYRQIYEICRNVEDVMGLFSKELLEMDRNTVRYMMDEMQEEINRKKKELEESTHELEERRSQLEESKSQLEERRTQLEESKSQLEESKSQLEESQSQLEESKSQLKESKFQLEESKSQLEESRSQLKEKDSQLAYQKEELNKKDELYQKALKKIEELEKKLNNQ